MISVKVGDVVQRYLAGDVPFMELVVTDVDDSLVHCGDWTFDRQTGAEVDDVLGWGPNGTGTYLKENT